MGRATQGVRLINLKEGDSIASVAQIEREEEEEGTTDEGVEGGENTDAGTDEGSTDAPEGDDTEEE